MTKDDKIMRKDKLKTIKAKILDLISTKPLSTWDIWHKSIKVYREESWLDFDNLMTYVSILKKENKIIVINNKKPYKYLSITANALLKRLYLIVTNKMTLKKHFHLDDIEDKFTLKIIEQMFVNE